MEKELLFTDKEDWRSWLDEFHAIEKNVWLVFYKKNSSKQGLVYLDAVEEALCYGWIDSIVKKIDEEKYKQKFTPRNKQSYWSDKNKERVNKLIKEGRMTRWGMDIIEAAKKNGSWDKKMISKIEYQVPQEFKEALENNIAAKDFFDSLADSYKRQYIGWIASAKKNETRIKRINKALELLKSKKKLGLL